MTKLSVALFIFLSLCTLFLRPKRVEAIAKFNTIYQINYQVEESGNTHVNFVISQRNNLSVVYATDFGISVNETKLKNIKVKDEGIQITPDVLKTLNQTTISFPFVSKIVGKDKLHNFTIEYDTTDIATKQGNTWQIDIPRLEQDENVSDQIVTLTVPPEFTAPAYIDPKPDIVNGNIYYFSGKKVGNKPISAIFGKTQYYRGKIIYHLQNNEKEKVQTDIALPPDTSYQTVYYEKLEPRPIKIYTDNDRNILATYLLNPNENLDVNLDLVIKLNFNPSQTLTQPSEEYLKKNSIWNFDNSIFSSPELKNINSPKSIYDFVVDKMKYDYGKINRQRPVRSPAAESLINYVSAICTDFTDVYVSLARRSGIYARELEGYAISENPDLKPISLTQDVLHAWPEYYDKERATWIQIDPTWANTTRGIDYFNKLDFNHVVFVIHGSQPEYPVPAGGYKNGEKTKDISIEPIDEVTFPTPVFKVQFIKQEGGELLFSVSNLSGVSYSGNAKVNSDTFLETSEQIMDIPPYSEKSFRVRSKKQPFISITDLKVIIYINGQPYESTASLGSVTAPGLILAGIGGVLGITFIGSWGLHLRRQKQKTTLYR